MSDTGRAHILITGASSGLGATLAQYYADLGVHRLTLMGRDAGRLDAVMERCRASGVLVTTIACDVTERASMREALVQADQDVPVDILIANAGIGGAEVLAPPSGEPTELAHKIVDINFGGMINTVTPMADRFVARQSGHIVMIGSLAGFHGLPEAPVYSASKAAVRIYGEGLRRLLSPSKVYVTVVSPGFIVTPMSTSLPFLPVFAWSAERAARRIARGIERREAEVVFPWQLRALNNVLKLLPLSAVDFILRICKPRMDTKA